MNSSGVRLQLTGVLRCTTDIGFPIVKSFDYKDFKQIQSVQEKNREGFVVRFESGVRVKLKVCDPSNICILQCVLSADFVCLVLVTPIRFAV